MKHPSSLEHRMTVPIIRRNFPPEAYERLLSEEVPEVLARIYAARGVTHADQMKMGLSKLLPLDLLGLSQCTERLLAAIDHREPICIVGDYDADGGSATSLLVSTLREWDASVSYLLPNRFTQGYGLSPALAEQAAEQGAKLLITVDNGIAAISGVERARELGLDVIVTDHHLPGPFLPQTPYILNPNQPGCQFPSKSLCGVGVAYYLVASVWRQRVLRKQSDISDVTPQKLLDLVALGTVADVVSLDANNRRLVFAGLRQIREGKARPGIMALLEVAGIDHKKIVERDLGFSLGPRLNAAGRLEDMYIGVELLLASSIDEALPFAQRLDQLNRERRTIEHERLEATIANMESEPDLSLPAIVISDPNGHEGVVGLIAGRLKERYYRPAIVFAPGEDPDILKGSARSVPGVHIRDLLAQVDAIHPSLILRFGGHAMAAGLTIKRSRFADFRARFLQVAVSSIAKETLQPVSESDGHLPIQLLTVNFTRQLEQLGPWGQSFPSPSFDGRFLVLESRRVGKDGQTLRLRVRPVDQPDAENRPVLTVVQFRCGDRPDPKVQTIVRLHFHLQVNWYQGIDSLQLFLLNWQESQEPS